MTQSMSMSIAVALVAFPTPRPISAQEPAAPVPLSPSSAQQATWDVDQTLGPGYPLSFETDEGTWMNVDVSADGQYLVFDLLGDLYTMPITGGLATRISSGQAFDMQPRYSPDGSSIAFISDRDGHFNVWRMDPDGSNLRQVSEEEDREVNSPAWSSDSQYVYARKHFVDTRSLGAGEVWMYHVSGGTGLQVTEKDGWQKDQGEPAASGDGRYLYYSRNVYPGQLFQYDKNVYQNIYSIFRRDLTTGEERAVARRPGGSITPRPSPDGTKLAFIKRVRLQSVLHLHDLETGEEWPLFDRLDRDMQEAWAIHGVYTQYDWTPDGNAIVIWGQGKIWRVDASTGEANIIPFTAQVDQTIHQGLRFQQQVAPESFNVRMLRDVTTSPAGRFVAYSALGKLHLKELPLGTPRRLTRADAIEFAPSFSPDDQWVAYATWSDTDKGRIRVVRSDGSGGRDAVSTPGHYTEPAFSPDGRLLVYRSTGGDQVRGPTHGENPGIFVVPVDGSVAPLRIRRSGARPRFDHTGERIFVNDTDDGKHVLVSIDLHGSDQVVHFQSENATQIVPSPDGVWVAFTERFRTYLATFPRSGRTITLGPDQEGFPVAQVSENTGEYLHWSGDGRSLHWSLGPEYFTRDVSETFSFVRGGSLDPSEPEGDGLDIGFSRPSDVPAGVIALVDARIVPLHAESGESGGVIEHGTIVVTGNRITALGPTNRVAVPTDALRVDATGKTIIPGIVDVHAHVRGASSGILAETNWSFVANLAYGVTTSHDPSSNTATVFTNSEMIRAGAKVGPRLFSTGAILYGAEGDGKAVVTGDEDARRHVARMKAVGAFSVKSYNQRRRDARQWIIKAGRELEMMVVPEGGSLVYNNMTMVYDGHTGVEHSLPVPVVYNDLAQLFGQSSTGYTPTLVVGYGGLTGENYWYERTNVWENERLLRFVPRDVVDPRSRRRVMAAGDADFNHIAIARGAKTVQDAGGLVALGAHGQMQGLGAHWELWMFVQGGMTEVEALRVATLNGARYLGLDADIGSLEVGKLADLVVLDENPLDSIQNSATVNMVMVNGRLYDADMNEVGNRPRERMPLYWERRPSGAPASPPPGGN